MAEPWARRRSCPTTFLPRRSRSSSFPSRDELGAPVYHLRLAGEVPCRGGACRLVLAAWYCPAVWYCPHPCCACGDYTAGEVPAAWYCPAVWYCPHPCCACGDYTAGTFAGRPMQLARASGAYIDATATVMASLLRPALIRAPPASRCSLERESRPASIRACTPSRRTHKGHLGCTGSTGTRERTRTGVRNRARGAASHTP